MCYKNSSIFSYWSAGMEFTTEMTAIRFDCKDIVDILPG